MFYAILTGIKLYFMPQNAAEWEDAMFQEFEVAVPAFPDRDFLLTDFGGIPGGKHVNTEAFRAAMEAASERGGRIVVPDGVWLTGPIRLLSNVNLFLSDNATIVFTKCKEDYPLFVTDYEGIRRIRAVSQLYAEGAENIAVTGRGTINGNGHLWRPVKQFKTTERQWKALLEQSPFVIESGEGGVWCPTKSIYDARFAGEVFPGDCKTEAADLEKAAPYYDFYRPVMLSIRHCSKVLIDGVTLMNSAAWNVHPYFCTDVTVRNIYVVNPPYAQNGDGLDVDSCKNVHIHHCSFQTGDDAICLKAGKDREARALKTPCENIYVHDCKVLLSPGCFVIGSEMSRGVRNVLIENCTSIDSNTGICFKSAIGRGGVVEDICFRNLELYNLKGCAVRLTMDYVHNLMDYHDPVVQSDDPEDIPHFRSIQFENCRCIGGKLGIMIHGLSGRPDTVTGVEIKNCFFDTTEQLDLKDCSDVSVDGIIQG